MESVDLEFSLQLDVSKGKKKELCGSPLLFHLF